MPTWQQDRNLPVTVLLVSRDHDLVAAVDRVALAAGVTLDVVQNADAGSLWHRVDLVLIGVDALAAVVAVDPLRRAGVVVVAIGEVPARAWRDAVTVGVEEVVSLPSQDQWLVDRLGEPSGDAAGAGPVIGVVGASGGVGASLLATGLAAAAAWTSDEPVMLVDLDRCAGGIDLLLGTTDAPGLRWKDLTGVEGRVSGSSLRESVLSVDGISIVTFGRDLCTADPDPRTVRSVINAARGGARLVVVDIPRAAALQPAVLPLLDHLVVVVRADVRSCVAARAAMDEFGTVVGDVRVGVRRPDRASLPDRLLEDVIPASHIYSIPEVRRVGRRISHGDAALRPRDSFIDVCELIVDDVRSAQRDGARAA